MARALLILYKVDASSAYFLSKHKNEALQLSNCCFQNRQTASSPSFFAAACTVSGRLPFPFAMRLHKQHESLATKKTFRLHLV